MILMKTLFKTLVLGTFLTTLGAVSTFAQDGTELEALFTRYKTERKAACGQRDAALATAKSILAFGTSTDPKIQEIAKLNEEVINYVKTDSAKIATGDPVCKRNDLYNTSYKAKDWAKFIPVSKEIIASEGDSALGFDVMLTLVSVGYNRTAVDKLDTYNNDTLNYAKMALQKLNSGKTSEKYGVFEPFKTKENATSWMNYIVGFYTNKAAATDPNKKKEALAYFYKSTQTGTENKNDVSIYTNIGDYYFTEAAKLDKEYRDIRAANNNTETDEAKAKLALARGYADRGIDAFGRARQIATANKATPKVIEAINKTLTDLYKFRFNIAPEAKTPNLETYVSGLLSKPMPDPATDVTPVIEEVAPATTTTTSSTTTTTPATNAATTNGTTKAATTTSKETPATNTATTTKTTTPVKKPVTKKKGTR
jgi:hypothetical protein